MNVRLPLVCTALLLATSLAGGQSVYKCVNADGSVSYQDRACPGAADEQKIRVDSAKPAKRADYAIEIVPIPGFGEAGVAVYEHMETTQRAGGGGATIGVRSKAPRTAGDASSILLTFLPNPNGTVPTVEQQASAVRQMAMAQSGRALGLDPEVLEFDTQLGTGLFAVVHDRNYSTAAAPPGEFSTMTVGQVVHEKISVAITILSNGTEGKGFEDALTIVGSFQVAEKGGAGSTAAESQTPATALPSPPAGYQWQRAPEIKAAFLQPFGWHFKKEVDGDGHAYFISREKMTADGFETGLTINVIRDVPAKTGMPPSLYAAEFIRSGASEMPVMKAPWSSTQGPFKSHGAVFSVNDPDKGDYNAHMLGIANDATGTVYLCIYEGPAAEWDAVWAIGEPMLKQLMIDTDI